MLFLSAADEAHRSHAVAIAVEGLLRRLAQFGAVGEAEIIVGAEIQDPAATRDFDLGRLRRDDDALGFCRVPRTSDQPVPPTNRQ